MTFLAVAFNNSLDRCGLVCCERRFEYRSLVISCFTEAVFIDEDCGRFMLSDCFGADIVNLT